MDINKNQTNYHSKVTGNILLFYVLDVGDDIDIEHIKNKNLLKVSDIHLSPFFKHYHVPLSFKMQERYQGEDPDFVGYSLFRKVYNFGVISFGYRIPFEESFEDLKVKVSQVKKYFDALSKQESNVVFDRILPAIKEPNFYNLKNSYFAIHVNPLPDKQASDFKDMYGQKIASLLRLETQTLSDYQVSDILSSTTGYYGKDMIIVDGEATFIYDDEYSEPLEFLESANIEKLELQYFDHLLDKQLNKFYVQQSHKVPLRAYIPLVSGRLELPVSRLAKLRVDISVVTERLESSVKLAGDSYFSSFYSMLTEKFLLKEWRESINKKLDITKDLYTVYQDRLDTIRSEILEIIIIFLIALELLR